MPMRSGGPSTARAYQRHPKRHRSTEARRARAPFARVAIINPARLGPKLPRKLVGKWNGSQPWAEAIMRAQSDHE